MGPGEEALAGGLGSAGAVVKVGSTVRRPVQAWTPAVHALLRHFEEVGFTGAPRVDGFDDKGREVLDYIPGDVAVPPFPAWSADLGLLVSIATLQRGAHLAAQSFQPGEGWTWGGVTPPRRFTGRLVCHNDICLENVVVRGRRAVAFIDWDWARPVDRLWDIGVAARHWIPLRDPTDIVGDTSSGPRRGPTGRQGDTDRRSTAADLHSATNSSFNHGRAGDRGQVARDVPR